MAYEFELSDIGEGVDEAEVLKWMVSEGDSVREDDPVVEVETDRAIIEIPSPVGGTVSKIHAREGETVPVGATVVTLDTEDDGEEVRDDESVEILDSEGNTTVDVDAEGTGEEPVVGGAGAGNDDTLASPSTRLLAREVGVDIGEVEGSGADGRVVAQDILRAAKKRQEEREAEDGREREADASPTEPTEPKREGGGQEGSEDTPSPTVATTKEEETAGRDDGGSGDDGKQEAEEELSEEFGQGEAPAVDPETTEETTMFGDEGEATEDEATEGGEEGGFGRQEVEGTEGETRTAGGGRTEEATGGTEEGSTETSGRETPESTETGPVEKTERSEEKEPGTTEPTEAEKGAEEPTPISGPETVPYTGARRHVGERLREASDAPLVTHHCAADAERLVEVRERLRGDVGARLTYTHFLVKACGVALEDHRLFNSELDAEAGEIRLLDEVDIGVATETEDGLRFPVVESVGEKGVAEIAEEVAGNTRTKDELPDSTFTVYNVGAVGGKWTTPLPTSAGATAVAAGEVRERPRVVGGEVVPRHTVPLSLTFDHRVADEAAAARFTADLKSYLNDPMEMLL